MKVITMCGSLKRAKSELLHWAEKLELEGNCVLSVIYPTKPVESAYTPEEEDMLDICHKKKIDLSDAIFVANKDGYIGSSTRSEIEYAKKHGKEIIFMEPCDNF
jgi:hypothetical protein